MQIFDADDIVVQSLKPTIIEGIIFTGFDGKIIFLEETDPNYATLKAIFDENSKLVIEEVHNEDRTKE